MPKINQPIAAVDLPGAFKIERAPRGGFLVTRSISSDYGRMAEGPLFACTDIDDALGFIKYELEPAPVNKVEAPAHISINGMQWTEAEAKAIRTEEWLRNKCCPHCGIPENHLVDDRCTRACMPAAAPAPEINKHGDIFK
ncbi:hypothetical protein [Bradyrhizobium sp. SZCCHNS1012]|uniref:hypothetical protein n=1 Tax=Bradyrhizobium sp. SZCCHNS1012 TaxID=3057297 RepID=UPI0029165ADE|nr:hypothetical protein [Bradyrhizobium sp. SZCCHNS1012]